MKSKFWSGYDAVYKFVYYATLILLPLLLLISELSEEYPFIQADVFPVNKSIDTLQSFSKAMILSANRIDIKDYSTEVKYLAPRPHADPLYLAFFSLCAVVIAFVLL